VTRPPASPFGQAEAVNFRYAKVCGGFEVIASAQSFDSLARTQNTRFLSLRRELVLPFKLITLLDFARARWEF
jgi:hypothetical protein